MFGSPGISGAAEARPHQCFSAPPRKGGTALIDYIPRSGAATAPAPMASHGAGTSSPATPRQTGGKTRGSRMSLRFGINGVGRIGRALLRLAHGREELVPAALNDVVPAGVLARLLARDTVHGPFPGPVAAIASSPGNAIAIGGREVPVFAAPEPADIPWASAGVDVVVEATGKFLGRSRAAAHLGGTVKNVVVSANPDPVDPVDADLCFGVNEDDFDPRRHAVVSNASCTTHCLALVAKVL